MTSLRKNRRVAAVARETQKEYPRKGQSRNTSVLGIKEFFEEIEGKVTEKLSQEFSRTKSCILGALSNLDDLLSNPQLRTHSGTVPRTFRNRILEIFDSNVDRSQVDSNSEVGPSVRHSRHSNASDPDRPPHLVTGVQEGIPYCSVGISSGNLKKARSTSQPHFCSENTLATVEVATRFCLPFNSWHAKNSTNSNNIINRI